MLSLLTLKSSLRMFIEKEDNNISWREMELVVSRDVMMKKKHLRELREGFMEDGDV